MSQFNTLKFKPTLFAPNGHIQTILGSYGRKHHIDFPSHHHIIPLADGDKLACEENLPHHWTHHHPTVILVHGLAGAHDSLYMVRTAKKLLMEGYRVIRVNLRACGAGVHLSRRPYHGGLSDDIFTVIKHFHVSSPTVLVGYSLGGNISLKLAGEQGTALEKFLRGVVVVCSPFDLNRTVDKILSARFGFYEKFFVYYLRAHYKVWATNHPTLDPPSLPKKMTLIGFDEFHTAPCWGFKGARHYYHTCSSAHFIPEIKIPCDIVCALDDPVVDTETIDTLPLPSCIKVWKTEKGGHMGFLGSLLQDEGMRWMDRTVIKLVSRHLA